MKITLTIYESKKAKELYESSLNWDMLTDADRELCYVWPDDGGLQQAKKNALYLLKKYAGKLGIGAFCDIYNRSGFIARYYISDDFEARHNQWEATRELPKESIEYSRFNHSIDTRKSMRLF